MANYKLRFFGKIPSTQTYAHKLIAGHGAADHTAIVAAAQSAGRGRYRRKWVSHHGNLYVSFIFDAGAPDGRLAYTVAVAVAESLIELGLDARIKWPNDIMVDGKKISGILIEYAGDFVIVGIGVNITSCPRVAANYSTTCVAKYCRSVTAMDLLGRIMQKLDWWRDASFADVRTRWMERAIGLNQMVRYRDMDAILIGIDNDGALVLQRDDERIRAYGDEIILN